MSFTFYTPAAHALLFQLAAGIVAHVAFRILKSVGEGKEKPTTLDYENDPNPGVREQENKAFSIALCTTSAFALSCYLKRDPYATAVPTIQALMAIAPLMNRNPIDKFGVAIGAVVLAVGTALAAVTAPFYNALSPVPSSEFGNAAIMPVMQWAVGSGQSL